VRIVNDFSERLAQCPNVAFQAALVVLRHHEDAEDVAQQAMARAHACYEQLRERDCFSGWLATISRRLAINHIRSERLRIAKEGIPEDQIGSETAIDALLARERAERLWKSIERLPEKLRIVTVLVAIQDQRVCDVAAMLHVSEGTIKKRLFLARQQLRKLLSRSIC